MQADTQQRFGQGLLLFTIKKVVCGLPTPVAALSDALTFLSRSNTNLRF
jgi:hypothetical protein